MNSSLTSWKTELEGLAVKRSKIEDLLPLSPLQEGIFFHSHYDESAADSYIVQVVASLRGNLDSGSLHSAVKSLLARHSSLRLRFRYRKSGKPIQMVMRDVELPWREVDLRGHAATGREMELDRLIADDRRQRFDLSQAPLLRCTLVRVADEDYRFVWSSHHILLDGWSNALLFRELFTIYGQLGDESTLQFVPPYRDYLAWIAGQDSEAAVTAWKEALANLDGPTRLASAESGGTDVLPERVSNRLSRELTDSLVGAARDSGVTLNTLIQFSWATLLARMTGRTDIVFGATVAGRPPEIPGIETMVGLFINTIPIRVRLDGATSVRDTLVQLQDEQARLMQHHHLGLAHLQRMTGLDELFDTVVAFENYPVESASSTALGGTVDVDDVSVRDSTHYPLSLIVVPGERLELRLDFRVDSFDRAAVEVFAARLVRVLETVVADPRALVGDIDVLDPAERHQLLVGWNGTARVVSEAVLPQLFEEQAATTPDAVAV
ncbi:condensation domain-containing protein, partial [Streptomyces albipurpureus]